MSAKTTTTDPHGKPLPMTHVDMHDGKGYRILFGPVGHTTHRHAKYYVLADKDGNVSVVSDFHFETRGAFAYIPGGV
jgi:hypothetical protein